MRQLNRQAVFFTPTQAFMDMLAEIDGECFEAPDARENDSSEVYLIPGEFDFPEQALEAIAANYEFLFENLMSSWYEDESRWPQDVTWEKFQEYFTISIQSMVFDVVPEKEIYEEE